MLRVQSDGVVRTHPVGAISRHPTNPLKLASIPPCRKRREASRPWSLWKESWYPKKHLYSSSLHHHTDYALLPLSSIPVLPSG